MLIFILYTHKRVEIVKHRRLKVNLLDTRESKLSLLICQGNFERIRGENFNILNYIFIVNVTLSLEMR